MYIKRTTKINKGSDGKIKVYQGFYLVEKVKNPLANEYKESIILNLSPDFNVKRPLWDTLCEKIKSRLYPNSTASGLFKSVTQQDTDLDNIADALVELIKTKNTPKPSPSLDPAEELVKAGDIIPVSSKPCLGEIITLEAISRLGYEEIWRKFGFTQLDIKLAKAQIVARCLHPASESETSRWIIKNSSLLRFLDLEPKKCYPMALHRISDKLRNNKEKFEDLTTNSPSLLDGQNRTLFTDLTNTFFEGTAKNIPLAKRGHSKEKRTDCPLISLAVVTNDDGFIVKSEFHPGNVSEPSTLLPLLNSTSAGAGTLVVCDKGLATKGNLEQLDEQGLSFFVADRRNRREFDADKAKEFVTASGSTVSAYPITDEDHPNWLKLLCFSTSREAKERGMVLKEAEKMEVELKKMIEGLNKPRGRKNFDDLNRRIGRLQEKHSSVARYFDITITRSDSNPTRASSIKYDWKDIDGSKGDLPGVYSLLSNDNSITEEELLRNYLKLTSIESVFRCLKSELGLRPIYHKVGYRVEGHMFITILAYQVVNYIRNVLSRSGIHESWDTTVNKIEEQKTIQLIAKANSSKGAIQIDRITCLDAEIKVYYRAFGLTKTVMKPSYNRVSKSLWDSCKAANY